MTMPSPHRLLILVGSLALALVSGWQASLAWQGGIANGYLVPAGSVASQVHEFDDEPLSVERLADKSDIRRVAALSALVEGPLDPVALRQLGNLAMLAGKSDGITLLRLSEQVSRRDLAAQLLLIEASAQAGDVAATLVHYDRALTVHPATAPRLLPLLAHAVDAPDIRAGLVGYARRPWFTALLTGALGQNADPASLAALVAETYAAMDRAEANRVSRQVLVDLLARGEAAAAQTVVLAAMPDASRRFTDPGFTAAASDARFVPLTWRLVADGAVDAQLEGKDTLVIELVGERRALAAERVTLLEAGRYAFGYQLAGEPGKPAASLVWQIRCEGTSGGLLVQDMATPAPAPRREALTFRVSGDCPVQRWRLEGMGDVTQFTSVARISDVRLERR